MHIFLLLGVYRKLLILEQKEVGFFFNWLASMPGSVISGGYKSQVLSLSFGSW